MFGKENMERLFVVQYVYESRKLHIQVYKTVLFQGLMSGFLPT